RRPAHSARRGAQACVRLFDLQRRLDPRLSAPHAAMDGRQELRLDRPVRPGVRQRHELPPGAHGLKIETRLNGRVMQKASTADLIFDVATLVSLISEAMTLEAGDPIITGTPVGAARKPPVFMKPGDVCEVEIEGIGILRNPIIDEAE